MSCHVLFSGSDAEWETYGRPLRAELKAVDAVIEIGRDYAASDVDYIVIAGGSPIEDFGPFTRAKAILRLWAGVEDIVGNETIRIPIARMVGGGLDQGMVEWVTAHTLRHHIGMDAHIHGQDGVWRNEIVPRHAMDRNVTILGLGALGMACARALAALGFQVSGWSRSPKSEAGIRCLSGPSGLNDALEGADIVILLLPKTPETENTLDAEALARLAPGAVVLNPGRGALIDDAALLDALESGQVGHATLDTFRTEPLPSDDPYWAHPKVTVTPHIASFTHPGLSAKVIAENVRRGEAGEPFLHLVDRERGY